VRAQLTTARALAAQLRTLAQHTRDAAAWVAAHNALGGTLYFLGALPLARVHVAQALALNTSCQYRRAAMSLGRLWQQQGKRAEACQLLAEIYAWFTEGFDTPDPQEAKALLDALA
jgi:alkylhydroperoxidase family enzyme